VLTLGDRVIELLVAEEAQAFNLHIAGRVYEVETGRTRARRREEERNQFEDGKWTLRSPLTGVVTEIRAVVGEDVEVGRVLIIIEAMKMLNELKARVAGRVSAVRVAERDRVDIGAPLIEISEPGQAT
jgi:biotin carboxyl carrier protein